ncbi:MAG: 50S ribosomal protein L4 [bacterium]|nr:50S ribosomal protein L4 [bacterium]
MAILRKDMKSSGPVATKTATKKRHSFADATAGKLEAPNYSMDGKVLETLTLPPEVFGARWRPDLVHQVTTALAANARQNRAHTKDRAEVSGGGRKPWKQKGTGQARHGSTRSPIWRHGGITFGPRAERDYSEKVNRQMKRQALISALSKKATDGEVLFVDKLSFAAPSTALAKGFLTALAKGADATGLVSKKKNAVLVATSGYDVNLIKSFRNIDNLATEEVRNLNALNVLTHKYLIIENPETAYAALRK